MHPIDCKPCLDLHRFEGDWCHAGGIINWSNIGIVSEHQNYGYYHIIYPDTNNCAMCGKDYSK
jgi:hypothetical protein